MIRLICVCSLVDLLFPFPFPFVRCINSAHAWISFGGCLDVSMIRPTGLRWRLEMKQTRKYASEDNLKLKASNYQMFLSVMCSSDTSLPFVSSFFFLPFVDLLRSHVHSDTVWVGSDNRLGQHNFTVILDCFCGPALSCPPSQGLPSFPNSCRCTPCQDITTTDQSLANSVFGSGQPRWTTGFANIAFFVSQSFFPVCGSRSFYFSLWLIQFSLSRSANKIQYAPASCAKMLL